MLILQINCHIIRHQILFFRLLKNYIAIAIATSCNPIVTGYLIKQ